MRRNLHQRVWRIRRLMGQKKRQIFCLRSLARFHIKPFWKARPFLLSVNYLDVDAPSHPMLHLLFWVTRKSLESILHIFSAHSAVVLKAESVADKSEWMNKIRNVIQPSRGGQIKSEGSMRQSHSDGYLVRTLFLCQFFNKCHFPIQCKFFNRCHFPISV